MLNLPVALILHMSRPSVAVKMVFRHKIVIIFYKFLVVMGSCWCMHVVALMLMDSSATETDDESPQDNPVHAGRRKKRRESDDATVVMSKKRIKRSHKEESPKKKMQLKTRTIYSDTKVMCCIAVRQSSFWYQIR